MSRDIHQIAKSVAADAEIVAAVRSHKRRMGWSTLSLVAALMAYILVMFVFMAFFLDMFFESNSGREVSFVIMMAILYGGATAFFLWSMDAVEKKLEFRSLLHVARDLSETVVRLKLHQATGLDPAEFAAMLREEDAEDRILEASECHRTGREMLSLDQSIRASM